MYLHTGGTHCAIHKLNFDTEHVFRRATRRAERYKFEVERYNVVKYKNSPYYKGAELWDSLPQYVTDSVSMTEFKRNLLLVYNHYQEEG